MKIKNKSRKKPLTVKGICSKCFDYDCEFCTDKLNKHISVDYCKGFISIQDVAEGEKDEC